MKWELDERRKYDGNMPKAPKLKFNENIIRETKQELVKRRVWDRKIFGKIVDTKFLGIPIAEGERIIFSNSQYWKLRNSYKGAAGVEKTFEEKIEYGISDTETKQTNAGFGIKVKLLEMTLSSRIGQKTIFSEKKCYTHTSLIKPQKHDWTWAIWQLFDVYEIEQPIRELVYRYMNFINPLNTIKSSAEYVSGNLERMANIKTVFEIPSPIIHEAVDPPIKID